MKADIFPHRIFFLMVNVLVWTALSYLDFSEGYIQPLYIYPVLIGSLFLPIESIAVTSVPLVITGLMYHYEMLSWDNSMLLVIYIFSAAPFIEFGLLILLVIGLPYMYTIKRVAGLEEEIATAPVGLTSLILTYGIGLFLL